MQRERQKGRETEIERNRGSGRDRMAKKKGRDRWTVRETHRGREIGEGARKAGDKQDEREE